MRKYIVITLLITFQFLAIDLIAGVQVYSNRLVGMSLVLPNNSVVADGITLSSTVIFNDLHVDNLVTFGVNHQSSNYLSTTYYNIRVTMNVETFNSSNVSQGSSPETLVISYDPSNAGGYMDKAYLKFTGAYKVICTLTNIEVNTNSYETPIYTQIGSLPSNFYLENEVSVERYYDMSTVIENTVSTITTTEKKCTIGTNTAIKTDLLIKWANFLQAEEYQLEYAFIDDHLTTPANARYDFKHNSTRISTNNTYYEIPLVGQTGHLVYRIRPVGVDYNNPSTSIYGTWSASAGPALVSGLTTGTQKYKILSTFEERLNWQMTTTYAENGKKKEVIGFRDGSQRNRQVVTRSNTDNNAIVGETVYDYTGRAAVTILPTPINRCAADEFAPLHYRANFNVNSSDVAYSAADFDADGTGSCISATGSMNTTSGASQYYSSSNVGSGINKDYIPDAKLYPFAQTEYTPDNTGRINRQSGVGPTHKLGAGHETEYLYGTPYQAQLDRLFGSEVGDAVHYKKNLVTDPNGQGSVSYLDMAGKVIATSIVGTGTANLSELSSGSRTIDYVEDLFNENAAGVSLSNTVNSSGNSIVFSKEILVGYESEHTFQYDLSVGEYLACDIDGAELCFDCVYDFKLEVLNNCGDVIISSSDPIIGQFTTVDGNIVYATTCSATTYSYSTSINDVLPKGAYTVVKTLTLNDEAFGFYLDTYVDPVQNKCISSLQSFIDIEEANIDFSGCDIDCEDCADELGEKDEFVANGRGTASEYDLLLEECLAPCNNDFSVLDAMENQMVEDMAPGGQYGLYMDENGVFDETQYPLSVYNDGNELPTTVTASLWQKPLTDDGQNHYYDADGNLAKVYLTGNETLVNTGNVATDAFGTYTWPHNLADLEDFIMAFETPWAKSLITYHPEYEIYQKHKLLTEIGANSYSSNDFDNYLRSIITYDGAVLAGFIDLKTGSLSDDEINTTVFDAFNSSYPLATDPFYSYSWSSSTCGVSLSAKMDDYLNGYSMAEVASMVTRCGNAMSSITQSNPTLPAGSPCTEMGNTLVTQLKDDTWNTFVSYYLSEKNSLFTEYVKTVITEGEIFNKCIGNEDYPNDFAAYVWQNSVWNYTIPCGGYTWNLYKDKIKRFSDPENDNIAGDPDEIAYQSYIATGKCPLDLSLETFLNSLNNDDELVNTAGVDLFANYASYGLLYNEITKNQGLIPSVIPACLGSSNYSTATSTSLTYTLNVTGVGLLTIKLIRPTGATFDWNDIEAFYGLSNPSSGSIVMVTVHDGTTYSQIELELELTGAGFYLGGCSFPSVCGTNDMSEALSLVMNNLSGNSQIGSTSYYILPTGLSSGYSSLINLSLENTLGTPFSGGGYQWKYSTGNFELKSNSKSIKLEITSPSSISPSTVDYFSNVESMGEHYFKMTAHTGSTSQIWEGEAFLVTSGNYQPLSMGNCGLPTPLACRENGHKVREDLEELMNDILVSNDYNIFNSPKITTTLLNALPTGLSASSGVVSGKELTITMGGCNMVLTMDNSGYLFTDVIGVNKLIATGTPINNEFYDFKIEAQVVGNTVIITGTSCLPLKNCAECEDEVLLPNYGATAADLTTCEQVFGTYLSYATTYNTWAAANNTPSHTIISMEDFINYHCYCAQNILNYLHPDNGAAYTDLLPPVGSGGSGGPSTSFDGTYDWTRSVGSSATDKAYEVTVDYNGNVITTGEFYLEFDADPGTGVHNLNSNGGRDIFIQKLDAQGKFLWAVSMGAEGEDFGMSVEVDALGNIYTIGQYDQTVDFDPGNGYAPLTVANKSEVFIQKLDENGIFQWVKSFEFNSGNSITIDDVNSRLYATGDYTGRPDANPNEEQYMLPNAMEHNDIYIVSLDLQGNFALASASGGPGNDVGNGITVDLGGNVFVTGSFENTANFNSLGGNINITSNGLSDIFVMKTDPSGQALWVKGMGAEQYDKGNSIAVNAVGDVHTTGDFNDVVDFDPSGSITSLTSLGNDDVFVQKLGNSGNFLWAKSIGTVGIERGMGIDVDVDNDVFITGKYTLTCDFDPSVGGVTNLTSVNEDAFIWKLTTSGQFQWAKSTSITEVSAMGESIKIGPSSNIHIAGHYLSDGDFNPNSGIDNHTSNGLEDIFVLKLLAGDEIGEDPPVVNDKVFPDLMVFCDKAPCIPSIDVSAGIIPITYVYVNPCKEQLKNLAVINAQIKYETYINDLTSEFIAKYKAHCLTANEDLTVSFTDKEHQYTLYYYDQAGNLVRTIPPAGVEPVDLYANSEQNWDAIKADRANGTHNFKTEHRLATTYTYNSLNQLTKQSVPDHDKIEKRDLLNVTGLHANMVVKAIQFTDNMHGYASGYIAGSSPLHGIMYKTSDAGDTWQKVNGLLGTDLKAIQMVDANVGFAVGTSGVFVKTTNGGASWELVNLYTANITGSFNDVYFESTNVGMLVGDDGLVVRVDFSSSSIVKSTTFSTNKDITSIGYESSGSGTYYITVNTEAVGNTAAYGQVYTNSGALGDINTWTLQIVSAPETDCMYYCAIGTKTWAGGENGLLINSANNGTLWTRIATDAIGDFKDVYFFDADNGLAIIDNGTNSYLHATYNGGVNWTILSTAYQFNSIKMFSETGAIGKVLAAGDNGALAQVIVSPGTSFGLSPLTNPYINATPQVDFNKAVLFENNGATIIAAAGINGSVYLCENYYVINAAWEDYQISSAGNDIENLEYKLGSSGNHIFVTIDDLGNLEGARFYPTTGNWNQSSIGSGYGEILLKSNGSFIGIPSNVTSGDNLIKFSYAGGTTTLIQMNTSKTLTDIKNVLHVSGSDYIFAAKNGYEKGIVPNSGSFTATEAGSEIVSSPLNSAELGTTYGAFVGNNGTVISTDYSNGYKTQKAPTNNHLNDANVSTAKLVVCGNQGSLFYATLGTSSVVYSKILHSEIDNFNAVVANASHTLYAVGDNQTVLFANDYTSSSVINSSIGVNTTGNIQDVIFYPNSAAFYAVGDQSGFYSGYHTLCMQNHSMYTPKLVDHHFYDNNHGYVIGDNHTIRYTSNGGSSWSTVLPGATLSSVPNLKAVEMLTPTTGVVMGDDYGAKLDQALNTVAIAAGITAGYLVNDMAFTTATHGLLVGKNGTSAVSYKTIDGGDNWTSVSLGFSAIQNGLHALNATDTYYSVGESGTAYFIDVTGTPTATNHPTDGGSNITEELHAVTFADANTAYAVGASGKVIRGQNITYTVNTVNAITWEPEFDTEIGNVANPIYAIDFIEPHLGMIGGEITTNTPNEVLAYRIKFEPALYSSYFYYDGLGRLIASQNAKQYAYSPKRFSYTIYDELGRISEVGEKSEASTNLFKDVFGTLQQNTMYPDVIDNDKFTAFIAGTGARGQVTKTYYDEQVSWITKTQENLRHRVASVTTEMVYDNDDTDYDHASHYSYDIHGNVAILYQENKHTGQNSETFKQLDYDYDLVSGNLNQVSYQANQMDAWYHKYSYDAENRIVDVHTSDDGVVWDMDAKYWYYEHGLVARVELGENNVQGLDYAYTLQGWLKGVNSNALNPANDIGHDGSGSGVNGDFAKDVMGFTIGYFSGDYSAIGTPANNFEAATAGSDLLASRFDLYNGNIGHMVTTIVKDPVSVNALIFAQDYTASAQGMAYTYDQLNRIKEARAFHNISNNVWLNNIVTATDKYLNNFTYDANGNILTQNRYDATGAAFDNLSYRYHLDANGNIKSNRLYHYNDANTDSRADELAELVSVFDNDDNDVNELNNFTYDELGNLVSDAAEEIAEIKWRVDGKIESIERVSGSTQKNLSFAYDAMGDRIAKHIYTEGTWDAEKSIFYVRDATGNVMSTYERVISAQQATLTFEMIERPIYGASRVGLNNFSVDMLIDPDDYAKTSHFVGARSYELSNHLGNVLSVITDQLVHIDSDADNVVDHSLAIVTVANDYYAFGSSMRERSFSSGSYRYGFNGMEKDDEVKGGGNSYSTEFRQYDPRLARWLSLDPLMAKYPGQSPYAAFNNNPIYFKDPTGLEGDPPNPVKTGTDTYYQDRTEDFKKRNPDASTPTYYGGYGEKYLNKFKSETRETLSPKGQQWLDDALVNLQDEMEKGLMSGDPDFRDIELNDEAFTDFAFDTHVKAYEDAGILSLDVMDKVKIMLTVEPEDLFSGRGLKQAGIVAIDQLQKYVDEPAFAVQQAAELYTNQVEIMGLILNYAIENNLDPSAVRDIIMTPFSSLKE